VRGGGSGVWGPLRMPSASCAFLAFNRAEQKRRVTLVPYGRTGVTREQAQFGAGPAPTG